MEITIKETIGIEIIARFIGWAMDIDGFKPTRACIKKWLKNYILDYGMVSFDDDSILPLLPENIELAKSLFPELVGGKFQ